MRASGCIAAGAVTLGIGAGLFFGAAVASATPEPGSSVEKSVTKPAAKSARQSPRRPAARPQSGRMPTTTRVSASTVTVTLPRMPVTRGSSFTVSADFIKPFATDFVAAGGNPADSARFFFGELAVRSLDALAESAGAAQQHRLLLGNLAASGYFGGIWLRDNVHGTPTSTPALGRAPSVIGLRLFDAASAGLSGVAAKAPGWLVSGVAHVSVPVLLALYGYNRGYLHVLLEHPPAGVPPMQDTLSCDGFLDCNSSAFPLELATRFDAALGKLDKPTSLAWAEMAMWKTVLQSATGAGRLVWEGLARSGFSPASYSALVELSSAYLMITKAAVLSSMTAYAEGDAGLGRSSLRLQAGLWMWSGAYFAGLASDAAPGTIPKLG